MKILITGGKSATALKLLKAFTQYHVILADYGDVPSFSSQAYTFISLGEKNEDSIAHLLLSKCLDEEVDVVLPIHDFEIIPLAKSILLFDEFNISVLLPMMDNLANYHHSDVELNSGQWIVLKKGETLFKNFTDEDFQSLGSISNLNGAFYFNRNEDVANLKLITI